jgi:hypothetical protein
MKADQFFDLEHRPPGPPWRGHAEDDTWVPAGVELQPVGGRILRHRQPPVWIQHAILRPAGWPKEGDPTVRRRRPAGERTGQATVAYLATLPVDDFNRIVQVPGDGTPKLGWILWHVFEQVIHHRGELFLCLSLLGLQRPKIDRPG